MGALVSRNYGADPDSFPDFRCLHQDFAVGAALAHVIWTDAGSGAHQDARVYAIQDSEYFWASGNGPVYRLPSLPLSGPQ